MPIAFACDCGKTFKVPDDYAGKRTKCPACQQALVVPTPQPEPQAVTTESAEDAAFRALSEGPEPEPLAPDWRTPTGTSSPSTNTISNNSYANKTVSEEKPKTKSKPSKPKVGAYSDPYASREPRWQINWGVFLGGLLGFLLGAGLLFGGLAAGRFFIWSPIILIGGIIGMINGILNKE